MYYYVVRFFSQDRVRVFAGYWVWGWVFRVCGSAALLVGELSSSSRREPGFGFFGLKGFFRRVAWFGFRVTDCGLRVQGLGSSSDCCGFGLRLGFGFEFGFYFSPVPPLRPPPAGRLGAPRPDSSRPISPRSSASGSARCAPPVETSSNYPRYVSRNNKFSFQRSLIYSTIINTIKIESKICNEYATHFP